MTWIIILLVSIVIGVVIFSVIEEKIKYKDYEPEELTEKEKTMKALRILIYIVIIAIIITILYKTGIILSLCKKVDL